MALKSILLIIIAATASPVVSAQGSNSKAKQNYERYCASCHGFNGMSITPGVPNLRMNEGLMQPDFQIVQKLKMGSPKKPPMLGIMTDAEIQDVVTYSRMIR